MTMLRVPQIEDARPQRSDHCHGDRKKAEECFQKGSKIVDSQVTAVEFEEYKQNADPSDLLRSKKPATESAFQSSGETKPVHIHPTDPEAAPARICTTLDPK